MMFQKIRKTIKIHMPKRLNNKEGAVLIISMFVLTVLFGLTACFSLASVGELNESSRYVDSAEAFWAAEAAINRFIQNTAMLDNEQDDSMDLNIGGNTVVLTKDDSDSQVRVVTATATTNGIERVISVQFPADVPNIYDNTLAAGGNAWIEGFAGVMRFFGQSRISGTYSRANIFVGMTFDDLQENVDSAETTMTYADVNENGTADEFTDFVEYNRRLTDPNDPNYTGEYTPQEVVYIQNNDTVEIWPDQSYEDVRVIFVEGSSAGQGNVEVWFNSSWAADQNLTVVSTGSVTYVQPLSIPSMNSQLNTISWENYTENAIFISANSGVNYTHGSADFGSIASLSRTDGALFANQGINADLIGVAKEFYYESPIDEYGFVPPAFQGLVTGGQGGYLSTPSNWAEVWEVAGE